MSFNLFLRASNIELIGTLGKFYLPYIRKKSPGHVPNAAPQLHYTETRPRGTQVNTKAHVSTVTEVAPIKVITKMLGRFKVLSITLKLSSSYLCSD